MSKHKHAELLRMAADNADLLFEYEGCNRRYSILYVLAHPEFNWRPVKQTKTIKRWLWADKDGIISVQLYSDDEIIKTRNCSLFTKLLWSETEFEVTE